MKNYYFLILFMFAGNLHALVPLEGIIYGDVKDVRQYDPLSNVFTKEAILDKSMVNEEQRKKLEIYNGLFREGTNLKNKCELAGEIRYQNSFNEVLAKRSVVSTLQYIGLDYSMRAIVNYSKLLEYSEEEFQNLVNNLITNTCSKNLTIYSLKLLKDNFNYFYLNGTNFSLPSINESPYFTKSIKERTDSRQAKENEFNLSVKNFRAFCSWGGDTDDYRMLVPYLNNPYVMSIVFNHLMGVEFNWDHLNKKLDYKENPKSIKVACEDSICRRMDYVKFSQKFPKMIGSTDMIVDLQNLYCGHFNMVTYKYTDQIPQIKKWLNTQTIEEPIMESMNFLSLMSGVPDLLVAADKYNDLLASLKENIDTRWKNWATEKNSQFVLDLMYEESLNIDMISLVKSEEVYKGKFQLLFDFTLGELDRVLEAVDKISASFDLTFPKSYLRWIREDYIKRNNKSDFKGLQFVEDKLTNYVSIQLAQKEKLFLIPMWSDKMSRLIAKELIEQIINYKGNAFVDFSHKKVSVPVKFRFGLFALKYMNEKFRAQYRSKSLTLNK